MKRLVSLILATVLSIPLSAQIATPQTTPDPVVLTLDDALVIALSENIAEPNMPSRALTRPCSRRWTEAVRTREPSRSRLCTWTST